MDSQSFTRADIKKRQLKLLKELEELNALGDMDGSSEDDADEAAARQTPVRTISQVGPSNENSSSSLETTPTRTLESILQFAPLKSAYKDYLLARCEKGDLTWPPTATTDTWLQVNFVNDLNSAELDDPRTRAFLENSRKSLIYVAENTKKPFNLRKRLKVTPASDVAAPVSPVLDSKVTGIIT